MVVVNCISCPQEQQGFFFKFYFNIHLYYLFTIFGVLNEKKKQLFAFGMDPCSALDHHGELSSRMLNVTCKTQHK